jgi:hypothetical protein
MTALSPQIRRVFHACFADWLYEASVQEMEKFQAMLESNPSPDRVRSLLTFVREGMADPQLRQELPANLVQRLTERNWPPGGSSLQVV